MKIKANNIDGFIPSSISHTFFLDTNVWMYLIFPQHSDVAEPLIKKYSALFSKIIDKDCLILSDLIQVSEIINLILHIEYKKYKKDNNSTISFKDFRGISEASTALSNAKILINNITKTASLTAGIFSSDEMKEMAKNCEKADFNDLVYANLCSKKNAILVTHDFDFNALESNLTILSANSKYF